MSGTGQLDQPPTSKLKGSGWDSRYLALDAWRGIAALGVVLYHLEANLGVDIGHASVMVFFVISGYCISASAESCRLKGVGPAGYMWRRMRRIYPPYFFSICYFVLTRLWKIRQGLGDQLSHSPLAWIQNLTLTQWLSLVRHPVTSAFDNQTLFIAGYWSLNYEEQFYIVVGVLLLGASLLSRELKSFILVLMVPAFVWNLLHPSICYGFFLEYYFSFGLGAMVFYRLCRIATPQIRRLIDASLVLLLLFSVLKNYTRSSDIRSVYFEWMIASAFCIFLLCARRWDTAFAKSLPGRYLRTFGLISYSLYLTQQCNLRASSMVANQLMRLGFPTLTEMPIRLVFVCGMGAAFWFLCERPFLNRPISSKRSQPTLTPASV